MKSHALRLYVVAVTLLVFFVLWAVIAARPWARAASSQPAIDPRVVRLDRWQRQLKHEAKAVNRLLERRWSVYDKRLRERETLIRRLERRHAQEVAAAQAAQAQAVAATATSSPVGTPAATPAASGSSPKPAARVVTLPPQVKVVNVPSATAVTTSGSSHP